MRSETLYENGDHKWIVFGRDKNKPEYIIDTNEYVIISDNNTLIMDPGGTEIFPEVVTAISGCVPLDSVKALFGSHQDPDIISSLSLWLNICEDVKVYVPWTWTDFITHFGCDKSNMIAVPDEGMQIELSRKCKLDIIPAHYLHASGNNHLYDPSAKMYFSGDMGGALMPEGENNMFVEDFDKHTKYMETFHKRWMPSNVAKQQWLERVRKLNIDMFCPQHGAIFKGEMVGKFFDWIETVEFGSALIRAS